MGYMELKDVSDLYSLISSGVTSISTRKQSLELRKKALFSIAQTGIIKIAFDTRRINQELEYNPRRGLQNYHRSEQFITEASTQKIKNFQKLKEVLEELKEQYERDSNWQDSYVRVLLNAINGALRVNQKDGDFSENQPSIGSFDYLEELLYVRYRLHLDNIQSITQSQLKKLLLSKDEVLVNKDINNLVEIKKSDVSKESYDTLLNKLFDGVKATKENPNVQRSITITINDKFIEE